MTATVNPEETAGRAQRAWPILGRVLGTVCAVVLVAMALLTSVDVVARYGLNSPIKGAFELTEILLACLVFLSFPIAARDGAHIEVELFDTTRKPLLDRFRKALVALSGLVVFGVLAYQIWRHAVKLDGYGQVTNSLEIPLALVGYLASSCCLVTFVVLIFKLRKN